MQPLSSLVAHKDVQRLHRRRACASVWVPFRLRGGCYRVVSYRVYVPLVPRYSTLGIRIMKIVFNKYIYFS